MSRFFDNTDDSIQNATVIFTVAGYTIFAWHNSNNITGAQHIVGAADPTVDDEFYRTVLQGNVAGDFVRFNERGTSNVSAITTLAYSVDVWQNSIGISTSTTSRTVQLNGANGNTDTTSSTLGTLNQICIGRLMRSTPTNPMDGEIAHACYYSALLTIAEAQILSRGVNPFFLRNDILAAYYPLDGNTSPEPEYVGQLNGTVNGATKGATNPPVELLENYL